MKSYSGNAIKKIINTFSSNEVKLEFEDPKKLYSAINSVINQSVSIHVNEIRKKLCRTEVKEYDIFTRQFLSNIREYTYAWLSLLGDEKISKHISFMKNGLYYEDGLFDLAGNFGICHKQDSNVIEGYYYSFSNKNFIDKDDTFIENIYDTFGFTNNTKNYLKKLRETNYLVFNMHYLAFDFLGIPRKFGFRTNVESLVASGIEDYYEKYLHFDKVIECISRCENGKTEIGIQFVPNKDYIAIDIHLLTEDIIHAVEFMLKSGIIGTEEEKYIKTLFYQGIDSGLTNVTWKYRWNSSSKFTIKHYNYFPNLNMPSFLTGD